MPQAGHKVGESFPVQFAWRLPDGDYIRAVFQAEVLEMVPAADKYIVRLNELIAGRQESAEGEMRPPEAFSQHYWALVGRIVGNKVTIAYEVEDGRALHMRLATLTGEHNFFTRFAEAESRLKK
jgi:hypothetical protein